MMLVHEALKQKEAVCESTLIRVHVSVFKLGANQRETILWFASKLKPWKTGCAVSEIKILGFGSTYFHVINSVWDG